MSVATQTFGIPLRRSQSGGLVNIGLRLWQRLLANFKASRRQAAALRAERELLAMAAQHDDGMPSFAAELRALNNSR